MTIKNFSFFTITALSLASANHVIMVVGMIFTQYQNAVIFLRNGANKENFGVVLMAVSIAEGIVGGHTGHYPTSVTFGPALFMLLGLCWGINVRQSKEKRIAGMA